MPLATLTVRRPKTAAFKSQVLTAVQRALTTAGVPEADLFQRVLELEADDFPFDPQYPDAATPRDANFVLIEILLSVGRSVKIKRKILESLIGDLAREAGLDPEHVMVVFKETSWENWAFAGGRILHA